MSLLEESSALTPPTPPLRAKELYEKARQTNIVRPPEFVEWPKGQDAILKFYGNPAEYPSPEVYWSLHGKFVHVPKDFRGTVGIGTHCGFWAHASVKNSLELIFEEIAYSGLAPLIKTFNGCYNHRVIRGGEKLSFHAFGAAIDINAEQYPLGGALQQHQALQEIFKSKGWTYGGRWTDRPDPMHWQAGEY